MLVACGPLLQPTGLCVCKAGGPARPPVERRQVAAETPAVAKKAGCCSRCHTPEAATPPSPRPPVNDGSHLPGCPASAGADALKWIEPATALADLLPPSDLLPLTTVEVVAVISPVSDTPAVWPSAPPLYLSHCSFVI